MALETGIRVAVAASIAGGAAVAATNVGLNVVTGEKRQAGDKENVFAGAFLDSSSSISNLSSGSILALLGRREDDEGGSIDNTMLELFRDHDDYEEERIRSFIQKLNFKNSEVGIKPSKWKDQLHMDIFEAFGAPGHMNVHCGMMVAYPGLANWFITISVDLQAIDPEILENARIPESVRGVDTGFSGEKLSSVKHTLSVVDGIDKLWKYKKSVSISLLQLFNTVAKAMAASEERSKTYSRLNSNCVHFKNDVLNFIESLKDNKQYSQKIPYKTTVTKFDLNMKSA
jgi:hypothetical protein